MLGLPLLMNIITPCHSVMKQFSEGKIFSDIAHVWPLLQSEGHLAQNRWFTPYTFALSSRVKSHMCFISHVPRRTIKCLLSSQGPSRYRLNVTVVGRRTKLKLVLAFTESFQIIIIFALGQMNQVKNSLFLDVNIKSIGKGLTPI